MNKYNENVVIKEGIYNVEARSSAILNEFILIRYWFYEYSIVCLLLL